MWLFLALAGFAADPLSNELFRDAPSSGSPDISGAYTAPEPPRQLGLSPPRMSPVAVSLVASDKAGDTPMPFVSAQSIIKPRKPTSSLPTLSHRALNAASTSDFALGLRRSKRARRPSARRLESDEYQSSSQASSRPPSPAGPKRKSKSKGARSEPGNRPGLITQPRAASYSSSPGSSTAPGPQRGNPLLARPSSPGNEFGSIGRTEGICRATSFLGFDASKLPARIIKEVLEKIPNAEETQTSPMELEGGSAPAILQPTRGMVLGSGHQPPATRTAGAVNSPQASNSQRGDPFPLDRNEDTATEPESQPESVELGPGDSVSQRLPVAPPPLRAIKVPPQPPLTPTSHVLRGAGSDTATADSDSDHGLQVAHARKRPQLTEPPQPIHLSPRHPLHRAAPSTTQSLPLRPTSTHPVHPAHPSARHTAQTVSQTQASPPDLLVPPSTTDLTAVLKWAAQLASHLTGPGVTNDQGAGLSHQAGQISQEVAFDLVTTVLETVRSNLATTTPALQAKKRHHRIKPRHTDPVEDDAGLLEAEAALELGIHVRTRKKPTLADFPGFPRRIASLAIPDLIALACTQGAYESFGTLIEWAGNSFKEVWGRELGHLQLQKPPHALKGIMVHRMSWFRGETKVRVRPAVPFAYPFINPPRTHDDLVHNRELVKTLLPNAFHCLDIDEPDENQYEHPALRDCIATAFFWAPDAVGMVYHEKFNPIPLPAVAMVLTVMQHCIKEWKTGRFVARELDAAKQLKVYDSHLKGLLEYIRPAGRRLTKFRTDWFKYGVEYAGTLLEDEEPYQPITRAARVRPDTPDSDTGTEAYGHMAVH